jgi:hypothetical protein
MTPQSTISAAEFINSGQVLRVNNLTADWPDFQREDGVWSCSVIRMGWVMMPVSGYMMHSEINDLARRMGWKEDNSQ